MKTILVPALLVLALAGARPVDAQATSSTRVACDSVSTDCVKLSAAADSALRDVERAATELAKAVEQTVRQTANDPQLRISAMKVAAGALAVAQQTLVQNTHTLERMLADAARQIASAQAALESKAGAEKKP